MRESLRLPHVIVAVATLFILLLTTAPFHFDTSLQSVSAHLSRIRLNPLISPDTGRRISIPDFVQNLLLFVPFGAAAASAFGGARPRRDIWSAALLGCALSVVAEAVQLLTTDRISSSADVLANTAGALTGASIAAVLRRPYWAGFMSRVKPGEATSPMCRAALATALLVCIASWEPFDVTLDVGVVAGHVKSLRAGLSQISFSTDHIVAFVLFLLLGFMLTQCIRELHVRFPVIVGVAAVITAGIALEASQIFIESRQPTIADAVANAAGALAGALGTALNADVRSKFRVLTLVCLLAAGIAAVQWISGYDAAFPAFRNIALCLIAAYVGIWSAAHTRTQTAD